MRVIHILHGKLSIIISQIGESLWNHDNRLFEDHENRMHSRMILDQVCLKMSGIELYDGYNQKHIYLM